MEDYFLSADDADYRRLISTTENTEGTFFLISVFVVGNLKSRETHRTQRFFRVFWEKSLIFEYGDCNFIESLEASITLGHDEDFEKL